LVPKNIIFQPFILFQRLLVLGRVNFFYLNIGISQNVGNKILMGSEWATKTIWKVDG